MYKGIVATKNIGPVDHRSREKMTGHSWQRVVEFGGYYNLLHSPLILYRKEAGVKQ